MSDTGFDLLNFSNREILETREKDLTAVQLIPLFQIGEKHKTRKNQMSKSVGTDVPCPFLRGDQRSFSRNCGTGRRLICSRGLL